MQRVMKAGCGPRGGRPNACPPRLCHGGRLGGGASAGFRGACAETVPLSPPLCAPRNLRGPSLTPCPIGQEIVSRYKRANQQNPSAGEARASLCCSRPWNHPFRSSHAGPGLPSDRPSPTPFWKAAPGHSAPHPPFRFPPPPPPLCDTSTCQLGQSPP